MIFDTGISGLQAATSNLDVIGNNIANSSTIGFKGSRANFGDIYSAGGYGASGTAIGNGVMLTQVQQSFAAGTLSNSSNVLDLAIDGPNSFFVLNAQGAQVYTRAGQFHKDDQNYIVNSSGQYLTGFLADPVGNITGTKGNLQINTADLKPQASSVVKGGYNLNAQAEAPTVDWSGGAAPQASTYNSPASMTVYDSLGNSHVLSMYFIKADSNAAPGDPNAASPANTTNQWYVAFQIDNEDVPPIVSSSNAANLYAINFNPDGSFSSVQDTGGTPLVPSLIPLSYTPVNGANPLSLNIDLTDCTQFGSPFSVQSIDVDGYPTGQLANIAITKDGTLQGNYTNGRSLVMGQVQLANFANQEGLQNIGNVCWTETADSGQALIGTGNNGGFGAILSGRLEESNVDLTSSLVDLIGAQRDFQANAQTIRAGDAITQTIINLR